MTTARPPILSARTRHQLLLAGIISGFAGAAMAQEMPVYEGVDDLPRIELRDTEPYALNSSGGVAMTAFADYVKEASKGKITMEIFWGGSLMGANENAEGIASGLADTGMVAPIYDPASFPIANWLTTLGNRASLDLPLGQEALDAAHWEFSLKSPELQKEFADRGLQMISGGSGFAFDMLCTSPIKTLAEARGKRARAAGVVYSRELEALGMIAVPLIPAEMYEAFSRGIVDCIVLHPPGYNIFGMMDVPKDKYFVNMAFSGFNSQYFSVNKEKWDAMPPLAQQIIKDGYLRYKKLSLEGLASDNRRFGEQIAAGLATAVEPDRELVDALKAQQDKMLAEMINDAPPTVADPQAMIDEYLALVEKWQKILASPDVGWTPNPTDVQTRLDSWKVDWDFGRFLDRVRTELAVE